MIDYRNKVVWITGASSGIGEALAYAFAARGAHLVLSARRADELARVCAACTEPSRHLVLPLDLLQPHTFSTAVAKVEQHFGGLDLLLHNAGQTQRSYARDTVLAVDRALMELNYFAPVALTKAALPGMLARGEGQLVVISSVMGKVGTPRRSAYAASKHALHGFFDSLRAELATEKIRVSLVCPGYIHTPLPKTALLANGQEQGQMDSLARYGYPADRCAADILRGLDKGKAEFCVGGKETWAVQLARWLPWLYRRIIPRVTVT